MPITFVIDAKRTPLLPTCGARARILLNSGKAIVYSVIPFTIQLNRIVDNVVGGFKIGIDDGAKKNRNFCCIPRCSCICRHNSIAAGCNKKNVTKVTV